MTKTRLLLVGVLLGTSAVVLAQTPAPPDAQTNADKTDAAKKSRDMSQSSIRNVKAREKTPSDKTEATGEKSRDMSKSSIQNIKAREKLPPGKTEGTAESTSAGTKQ